MNERKTYDESRFQKYEYNGRTDTMRGWARWMEAQLGRKVSPATVRYRIHQGWDMERVINEPIEEHKANRKGKSTHNDFSDAKLKKIQAELNPNPSPKIDFERLITKRSQVKSVKNDTKTFYNGEVMDIVPKNGRWYDCDVLFRGSSSCVYWHSVGIIGEIELANLLKRSDVLRIKTKGEYLCRT